MSPLNGISPIICPPRGVPTETAPEKSGETAKPESFGGRKAPLGKESPTTTGAPNDVALGTNPPSNCGDE